MMLTVRERYPERAGALRVESVAPLNAGTPRFIRSSSPTAFSPADYCRLVGSASKAVIAISCSTTANASFISTVL